MTGNEFHYSDTILPNLYPLIWAALDRADPMHEASEATNLDGLIWLHDHRPAYLAAVEAALTTLDGARFSIRQDAGCVEDGHIVSVQAYSQDGARLMWIKFDDLGA